MCYGLVCLIWKLYGGCWVEKDCYTCGLGGFQDLHYSVEGDFKLHDDEVGPGRSKVFGSGELFGEEIVIGAGPENNYNLC